MIAIEKLLHERIGLDAASIGSSLIQRTVRLRMKAHGLRQVKDYEQLLEKSPLEWRQLVESVLVTETWFFRDREPFAAFIRLAFEDWLPSHPTRPLRLLSVPCSSGEEPYSLAMALVDAGIPPGRFQIDAADISARALSRASRGLYGRNSFRGKDLDFRDRYFQASREGFVLNLTIRKCVSFFEGNLLDDKFLKDQEPYDFIFCRNLLIYFDRQTQQRALEKISHLLSQSGVLFVGPAEQPPVLDLGFVSANIPMAFACRKSGSSPAQAAQRARPVKLAPGSFARPTLEPPTRPRPAPPRRSVPAPVLPAPPDTAPRGVLDQARQLADAGRLKEAEAICEAHLRQSQDSVHAHYLLGLVREAGGAPNAIDCYRKALYLDPNHYETLLQMALLAEKNGEPARARIFRRRAERLKGK